MIINTIIVDDERHVLDLLTILLGEYNQIKIVGQTTDALEAINIISHNRIDLLFVDIEMKGINGIELVSKIREFNDSLIIVFVTAHRNYTDQAIKLNVFNYLLKPIDRIELWETIMKVTKLLQPKIEDKETLLITNKGETIVLKKESVSYLQAEGSYTHIFMDDGSWYVHPQNVGKVLSSTYFNKLLRVNRSTFVRKDLIVSLNKKDKTCSFQYSGSISTIKATSVFLKQLNEIF